MAFPKILAAEEKINYVALGDSYTIGTGAAPQYAWPSVITGKLKADGIKIELIANLAKAGWDTQNVIDYQLPIFEKFKPTFATLLIGTNDVVRDVDKRTFKHNLSFILDEVTATLPDKHRLLVVTIPDFSVAPAGAQFADPKKMRQKITEFNDIIKEEAKKRDLNVFDLFPVSQTMKDTAYFSSDGLHPSAKGYDLWALAIYEKFKKILSSK